MRVLRPLHLERLAKSIRSEAFVAMPRCGHGFFEAHVSELPHRARGQPVATCLGSRELFSLHDSHVPARFGEPVGACGATRATANNDGIVEMV